MRLEYDPEVDALYIHLRDAEPAGSWDYEPGVTAVVDDAGTIIGLEILKVRSRVAQPDDSDTLVSALN